MSEMVERVAKALIGYDAETVEAHWPDDLASLLSGPPFHANGWRDMARRAIAAMREPSIPMVEQASHLVEGDSAVEYTQNTYEAWRLMIDTALGKVDA